MYSKMSATKATTAPYNAAIAPIQRKKSFGVSFGLSMDNRVPQRHKSAVRDIHKHVGVIGKSYGVICDNCGKIIPEGLKCVTAGIGLDRHEFCTKCGDPIVKILKNTNSLRFSCEGILLRLHP